MSHPAERPAIAVDVLTKTYGEGVTLVHAVDGVSFTIETGEFVVLLGASGSGKTTMLNMIGAIEQPTSGTVDVAGHALAGLDEAGRTSYRRAEVGFVFQLYNLVPSLTAAENVQLIAEITGPDAEERARAALDRVGLADRADHFSARRSCWSRTTRPSPAWPRGCCDSPTAASSRTFGSPIRCRRASWSGETWPPVARSRSCAANAPATCEPVAGRWSPSW